jgi:hypothetical protein
MAQANEYPRKAAPADTDDLLAVSNPGTAGWAVVRINIGTLLQDVRAQAAAVAARLTALENG